MNSTFVSAFFANSAEGPALVEEGPDTVEWDTVSGRVAWLVVTQVRLVLVHPVEVIVIWDVSKSLRPFALQLQSCYRVLGTSGLGHPLSRGSWYRDI